MTKEEAEEFGTELVNLDRIEINSEAVAAVPAAFARAYHFMPIDLFEESLEIAVAEADADYIDDIMLGLGGKMTLIIVGAPKADIDRCIERHY